MFHIGFKGKKNAPSFQKLLDDNIYLIAEVEFVEFSSISNRAIHRKLSRPVSGDLKRETLAETTGNFCVLLPKLAQSKQHLNGRRSQLL